MWRSAGLSGDVYLAAVVAAAAAKGFLINSDSNSNELFNALDRTSFAGWGDLIN